MSSIIFGYTMSLTTAATPSTGFLVAYDSDGLLKQKDSAGVITLIGGSGPGLSGTSSLSQVLSISNDSETHSIIMGTSTSILIGNSGSIDMASGSTIYMGTASSILSNNGLSALYFDYNSATSSVYLSNGYNYLSLTNATMSVVNSLGNTINITNVSNYVKLESDVDIFSNSEIRLRIFNTSDEISLKSNIGTSVTSANSTSNAIFIGSQASSFNANVINSVIIGGVGQSAVSNNSVYIPDTYIQDTKKIRGSLGDASLSFTDTNNLILENSNSLIALISSSSSTTLSTNGIIVTDSLTQFTSPAIDASPVLISTKNSSVDPGVHNAVIIGGENLIASLTNSVVLGENVNINNKYTLPNVDGTLGSYMITDGNGNLTWASNPTETQNLEDVLTLGNWTGNNSIEMGTASSIYSINGGGQINLDYNGTSNVISISTDGGNLNQAYIELSNDDIFINNGSIFAIGVGSSSIVVGDGKGLVYSFDYSATFVTHSLVTKGYVDSQLISLTSSVNFANTDLTLTGNRIHNTNGNDLIISSDGIGNDFAIAFQGTQSLSVGHVNYYQEFTNSDLSIQEFGGTRRLEINSTETIFGPLNSNRDFRIVGLSDSSAFFLDALNDKVGIGTDTPTEKFEVNGKIKTTDFQMTNSPTAGYVLTSDAFGNASWQLPGLIYYTEDTINETAVISITSSNFDTSLIISTGSFVFAQVDYIDSKGGIVGYQEQTGELVLSVVDLAFNDRSVTTTFDVNNFVLYSGAYGGTVSGDKTVTAQYTYEWSVSQYINPGTTVSSLKVGTNGITLDVPGGGAEIYINDLPTSSFGLSSGALFTQTATELGGYGLTKVLCIV